MRLTELCQPLSKLFTIRNKLYRLSTKVRVSWKDCAAT